MGTRINVKGLSPECKYKKARLYKKKKKSYADFFFDNFPGLKEVL